MRNKGRSAPTAYPFLLQKHKPGGADRVIQATTQKTDTLMLNNQADIDLRFEKTIYCRILSGEFHLPLYPRARDLGLLYKQHQGSVLQAQKGTWAPMLDYERFYHPLVEINKVC